MEPKNLNKTYKRIGKSDSNTATNGYNSIATVHNKFSILVSSKTVYTLRHAPKARYGNS